MPHIKCVLLDMHGVIADEWEAWQRWSERFHSLLSANGAAISAQDIRTTVLTTARTGSSEVTARVAKLLHVDERLAWDSWAGITPEKTYDNVRPALENLSASYPLAVVANASLDCRERLYSWGLTRYFKAIFLSAEMGVAKPDPAMWRLALTELGFTPGESVMVGDRVAGDLLPAHRLGLTTIRVMSYPFCVDESPSSFCASVRDVTELPAKLTDMQATEIVR